MVTAFLQDALEVGQQMLMSCPASRAYGVTCGHVTSKGEIGGPDFKLFAVLRRDTQQFRNDHHREWIGKLLYEIEWFIGGDTVQQPLRNRLDPWPHGFYRSGRKCL